MTPDVNVLLAALRSDHPHHAVARNWLESAVGSASLAAPLRLQPLVIASFLRLATHPRIFVNPTPIADALGFVDALLAAPGVTLAQLGIEWPVLRQLCAGKGLTANAIPDAWLAAAVLQQGEHLVSFDGDFTKLLPPSQFTRLMP
ncbi:MAG: PIN domain-containing protein [Acidovorax sp.]|uniref:TA system VapC family ribonuclease toxin n=1 Tax=Acidovorax sp. TaxID=1872122 RepID=UPI0039E63C35